MARGAGSDGRRPRPRDQPARHDPKPQRSPSTRKFWGWTTIGDQTRPQFTGSFSRARETVHRVWRAGPKVRVEDPDDRPVLISDGSRSWSFTRGDLPVEGPASAVRFEGNGTYLLSWRSATEFTRTGYREPVGAIEHATFLGRPAWTFELAPAAPRTAHSAPRRRHRDRDRPSTTLRSSRCRRRMDRVRGRRAARQCPFRVDESRPVRRGGGGTRTRLTRGRPRATQTMVPHPRHRPAVDHHRAGGPWRSMGAHLQRRHRCVRGQPRRRPFRPRIIGPPTPIL